MPVWNRANSIRMAVESVLRQSFQDFELLVVDDGSTDATAEVLASLSDPRLKLLANPRNLGASAARNTGLRAARADWVAFQDSDDEWLPQKLAKQMRRLAEANDPGVVGCYTGMAVLGRTDRSGAGRATVSYLPPPDQLPVEGELETALLERSFISTQMLMARREALLQIGGFDEGLPALEDWDCAIRLAPLGRFVLVDEPLVLQTFSDNSLTHSRDKWLTARIRILEKHRQALARHPAALAGHHVAIAGAHFSNGDLAAARLSLREARRADPYSLGVWLRSLRAWGHAVLPNGKPAGSP